MEGWRQGFEMGGHLASCMIMSCIAERVKRGWGTWMEVIDRIPKFSATTVLPNRDKIPQIWDPQFVRLLHEVDGIFDGSKTYNHEALYWADLRYIETDYFKEKILAQPELHPKVADMNSLSLFK